MKKFIALISVLFGLSAGTFAMENTITIDYGIPLLFWNDTSYDYFQHGYEIMLDWRMMNDDFGFQLTAGVGSPRYLTKTSKSSGSSSSSKFNTRDWFLLDGFAGISCKPIDTDLVQLFLTPGVGCTLEMVDSSSGRKSNLSFGIGLDVSANVQLVDCVGITAGVLGQYQLYQIERDYSSSTQYKGKVSNLYFIPRAGVYITF